MDFHCQAILEDFQANQETYNKLKEVVLSFLKEFASSLNMFVNSIEGRVKTEKSLTGKLELKGNKYKTIADITDIIGCRVVTFYPSDIDLFATKITSNFEIDWENSVDKRKAVKIDQFGYSSLHYICRLPKKLFYDEKYPTLNDIYFEVQIRTVLQHTWATIYHDIGYKNDVEVPSEYLRDLSRLAGLLEIADKEFESVKSSIIDYRKRIKDLVSSGNLSEVELNGDSFKAYMEHGGFGKVNQMISSIHNMDIEKVSEMDLLPIFKSLGFETLNDLHYLSHHYREAAYKYCIAQFADTDIDIMTTKTGPIALILVYAFANDFSAEMIADLLDQIYGKRKINARYAEKIITLCTQVGIGKAK